MKDVKRPYRSPLRAAQQAATRRQVIDAAAELFVRDGYAGTSIDAIAQKARVGRATVFSAVGGKPALLKAAYDVAVGGDDEPITLPERPWAKRVSDEPDAARMLTLYAGMVTQIDSRVAGISEAIRGAGGADADARELSRDVQRQRRLGAANVVAMLVARNGLRPSLDHADAAAIIALFIDPGLYFRLVTQEGWPEWRFETWLSETLHSQLLA